MRKPERERNLNNSSGLRYQTDHPSLHLSRNLVGEIMKETQR